GRRRLERRALGDGGRGVPAVPGRRPELREAAQGAGEVQHRRRRPREDHLHTDGLVTGEAPIERLRTFLLWLAGASAVGTMVELAMLRHWTKLDQLIPWVALI